MKIMSTLAAVSLLPFVMLRAVADPVDPLFHTAKDAPERPLSELVKQVGPAVVTVKGSAGLGSGFIIHEAGYLVTNAHVVEGENTGNLTVTVYENGPAGLEKTDFPKVKIIAYSGRDDLAVLKIEPKEPRTFTAVPLGDSVALNQGEKVFAFGSPLGLTRTTTEGNVSVRSQSKEDGFYVQHTAPIAPGNSGGPLFNGRGEVIGVNSQGSMGSGAIGFAIPSDVVKLILRNREAFAFDPSNPANGYRYLAPASPPAGSPAAVRILPPLEMKIDARASLLRQADIDGDRRADVILANNAEGRIDIFYQRTPEEMKKLAAAAPQSDRERPVLDNAPFMRESVTVADDVYDLLPTDFDGDGLVDLVYSGRRTGINVVFQTAPGKWEKTSRFDRYGVFPHAGTLRAADMDGDGKPDLVAFVQGGRALVFKGGSGRRDLGVPETVGVANTGAQVIRAEDYDGDGKPDLLFIASGANGERNLSLRLRDKDGRGFGPETAVTLGIGQPVFLPFAKPGEFATLGEKTGEVRIIRLGSRLPSKEDREELQPQILRPPVSGTAALLSIHADIDGDGRDDLVVADSEGAAIYVYKRLSDGRFAEATAFPSLKAVTSLAKLRLPGDKADRLVVASAEEKTVGLSQFKDGRLTFPDPLPLTTQPYGAAAITLGKDTVRSVVCTTRDGQRFNLEVLRRDDAAGTWRSSVVKLGTLGRDPSGMLVRDLNGDGLEDILVFVPREPARIILQKDGGSLAESVADDPVRKSQLDGVTPENIGFGDYDGDGREEMLVARTGFIRAYAFDKDNRLKLVDQANGAEPSDALSVPAMADITGDGVPRLLAYDTGAAALQVFEKQDGLRRYRRRIFLGKNEPKAILAAGKGADASLVVAGARQVWNLPLSGKQWLADTVVTVPSAVKDARFYVFAKANLTDDGNPAIAAVDGANDGIEIFSEAGGKGLASVARFRVFSDERLARKGGDKNAPAVRDLLGGDFDNDGKDDLVVLCHDRLLLYRRDK